MKKDTIYQSSRRTSAYRQPAPKRHGFRKLITLIVAIAIIGGVGYGVSHAMKSSTKPTVATTGGASTVAKKKSTQTTAAKPNPCADNTLSQLILVSISQQHLWACNGSTQAYDSAVVTGMELYPADLTPTGTYHIYAKETDQVLKGSDSTGSWSDPVSYWMPFLDNQYGEYGFHDATWRAPSDFGHININAPYTAAEHGSHGCVELPLATAKWLYGWDKVGTTVTIES